MRKLIAAVISALVAVAAIPRGALSQAASEFWPELDVSWKVKPGLRLVTVATETQGEDLPRPEHSIAFYADWLRLPRWTLRTGYKYKRADTEPNSHIHTGVIQGTFNASAGKVQFVNKLGPELRWVKTGYYTRVRGSTRVERPLLVGKHQVTPYVFDELFYDSRYGNIARNRAKAGARTPLWPKTTIDVAYLRQDNYRRSVARVNALTITLALVLR